MELTEEQSQAHQLFLEHRKKDPFPEIRPGTLNWNHITFYAEKTGMIFPFREQDLKTASYGLRLLGKCVYFDDKEDKRIEYFIDEGDELEVKKNSIFFLTLEPLIQLPDYIAARFNLKIDLVYKGFLMGTAPLVDPGFFGPLSFPLHNLTTNTYRLKGGEKIAWMEFTKLSSHKVYENKAEFPGDNIPDVPYDRKLRDVWDYMCESHAILKSGEGSIQSSIPEAMAKAESKAEEAATSAKKSEEYSKYISIAAVIALFLLVVSFFTFSNFVRKSIKDSELLQSEMLEEAREQVFDLRQEVSSTRAELDSLKQTVTAIVK